MGAVTLLPTAEGLPAASQYMPGVLLFEVIVRMTEAADYAISAVIITALLALLPGMAPAVAKPAQALGTAAV